MNFFLRGADACNTNHGIALISEWDTPYGRGAAIHVLAAVVRYRTKDFFTGKKHFQSACGGERAEGVPTRKPPPTSTCLIICREAHSLN